MKRMLIFVGIAVICLMLLCVTSVAVAETEVTISRSIWGHQMTGATYFDTTRLRFAKTFQRNTTYTSVAELPDNKARVDDQSTSCSMYVWMDGDDCYWWSDADIVYLPSDASYFFYDGRQLTTLDLTGFNTSKVTNMQSMFRDLRYITSLDVSGLDTSNVTNMYSMFNSVGSVTSLDVSGFDTSHVTNMGSMFLYCSNLTTLDVSRFNTSQVTEMDQMFSGCGKLSVIDVSHFNTGNVKQFHGMFSGCGSVSMLDTSQWDTHSAVNMSSMFSHCQALTTLDVSNFVVDNVTSFYNMFYGCINVTALDVSKWNTGNVTTMYGTFGGCKTLTELDVSKWDTHSVTNMSSLFGFFQSSGNPGCSNVTVLDVSNWDVSHVTDMSEMFYNCYSLTGLDLTEWNTANVTDMRDMFGGCSALTSLDLSSFDVSHVTDMAKMFANCERLASLDVSSFVTNSATNMWEMFYHCYALTFLDLSGFNTDSVTDLREMFYPGTHLSKVILGDKNCFIGADGATGYLPTPPASQDGIQYTRKWIREDKTYGPYAPTELRTNYTSAMAGTWVWEEVATEYTISFVCDEEGCVGSMPSVTALVAEDYEIPANTFQVFGKVFNCWTDGARRIYRDQDTIPANTYEANDVVTLTAVFAPRDTSIVMQDGEFTFSIKGDERAFFDGIPAGTSYSVFEENIPEDWVLIAQSNSTGLIYPLETSEALFLNKYQPDLATIQFTGRKLMDGQPAKADSFSFELWEGNILLQTKSVIDGGFVQFDILEYDRNDVGVHTYTIKELVGFDETILYDGHEETVAVEVTTEEGSDNVTRVHAEVTYSDGTYPNILFENWTKPGELSLKKLVDKLLDGHQNDEFKFRITFKQDDGLPLSEELTYSIEP